MRVVPKESWTLKNGCFWTVVFEKTLESPLDCKEIKPVNPKGNQSWIFIERTEAEAEAPILWPPDAKNWLLRKNPDTWGRLKAGGEAYNRGWDGWMASPTQWAWVWASSGSWWRTGKPGILQPMGSQSRTRLRDWIELNWSSPKFSRRRRKWEGSWKCINQKFPESEEEKRYPGTRSTEGHNQDEPRLTPENIIMNMTKVKERILKGAREKHRVVYKGILKSLSVDFSAKTLQDCRV